MKIVIAMDSFKGSIPSTDAGQAAAEGILRAIPDAEVKVYPVADGGEGTTAALVSGMNGTYRTVTVSDPLGRPVSAGYGILPDRIAVMEMAAASGLPLLSVCKRGSTVISDSPADLSERMVLRSNSRRDSISSSKNSSRTGERALMA